MNYENLDVKLVATGFEIYSMMNFFGITKEGGSEVKRLTEEFLQESNHLRDFGISGTKVVFFNSKKEFEFSINNIGELEKYLSDSYDEVKNVLETYLHQFRRIYAEKLK